MKATFYNLIFLSLLTLLTNCKEKDDLLQSSTGTFIISGKIGGTIQTLSNIPIQIGNDTTNTNENGEFSLDSLSAGQYFIKPLSTQFTYIPNSYTLTIVDKDIYDADFIAKEIKDTVFYTVAGTISGEAEEISGILVSIGDQSVVTDQSGNFSFLVNKGDYTITASKNGLLFSPSSLEITVVNSNISQLAFNTTYNPDEVFLISGQVYGNITDYSNITIHLDNKTTLTDHNGSFVFKNLLPGTYNVLAEMSGLSFNPSETSVTIANGDMIHTNFEAVQISYSISGSIGGVDTLSGVSIMIIENDTLHWGTSTNSEGDYSFDNLTAGSYIIKPSSINGWDFNPPETQVNISGIDVIQVNFSISEVTPIDTLYSVSGTIGGIADLQNITLAIKRNDTIIYSTVTNSNGAYDFQSIVPGLYILEPLETVSTSFLPTNTNINVVDQDLTNLNFTANNIIPSYSISGTIFGDDEEPLPGIDLVLDNGNNKLTIGDGSYIFAGLTPGTYTVTPITDGFSFTPPSKIVTLIDHNFTAIDFSTTVSTYTISGMIEGSVDLSNIEITIGNFSTFTDDNGLFTISDIPPGSYNISPEKDDLVFIPSSISTAIVDSDIDNISFAAGELGNTFSISGQVQGNIDVSGVTISVGPLSIITDEEGNYLIQNLPPGDYLVVPSRADLNFTPLEINVTILDSNSTGVNFTASN